MHIYMQFHTAVVYPQALHAEARKNTTGTTHGTHPWNNKAISDYLPMCSFNLSSDNKIYGSISHRDFPELTEGVSSSQLGFAWLKLKIL